MAKQIKGNDIVQSDALNPHIAELKEVLNLYKQIEAQVTKTAKDIKKISGSADANSAQGIQKMNKALVDSNKLRKESIAVTKQKKTVTDQLRQAEDAEVKGKLRLQEANKKQRTLLKEEIALEDKQIGTLKRLAIENAKLRREREALNLDTKKGQTRLKEINSALDQNNAKIRANSDAMKKQRLNVGNYGKAVSKVTDILKGFGATLLAAFSFQAIKGFFTSSVAAFQTQEKAVAKVEQALKSTSNAAGRTTEQLQEMATDLQGNTLFGDEDILNNATAQLLTFTNIAGSNFDRTQRVALDLATVLDGDLKSASIQLGKALNDPVANLSALSRSGIQFSASQKDMIKSLTESGRLAEAQTVILSELERQYGGQAAAAAEADGGITQLKNTFGDFKEEVGRKLLEALKPTIRRVKEFFESLTEEDIEKFTGALTSMINFIVELSSNIGELIGKTAGLSDAWGKAFNSADNFKDAVADTVDVFLGYIPGVKELTNLLFRNKTVVRELTEEQKRNNEVNKQAQKIGKEILSQNQEEIKDISILIDGLTDENTTREEKNKIIAKLQEDYPDYVKNIDLETASTEALIQVKKDLVKVLLDEAIERKKAEAQAQIAGNILDLELQKIGKNAKGVEFLNDRIKEQAEGLILVDEIAERISENLGGTIDSLNLDSGLGDTSSKISELRNEIEGLQNALKTSTGEEKVDFENRLKSKLEQLEKFEKQRVATIKDGLDEEDKLNKQSGASGGSGSSVDAEKKKLDQLEALQKKHNETLLQLEADFISMGLDPELASQELFKIELQQRREQGKLIKDLDFEDTEILKKHRLDYLKFVQKGEVERVEIIKKGNDAIEVNDDALNKELKKSDKKRQEEQLKDAKEAANKMIEISKILADNKIAQIDREIEARKNEISVSESEIGRLQDLAAAGNVDAAESIKAERVRQAQDKIEIENLEKKKADLLLKIATLNQANLLFQQSDVNGFQNANAKVKEFVSNLPTFYDGTTGTVADALGATGTRDGHMVRVHDNEHIIGSNDSTTLHAAGLKNNADIVGSALAYQNAAANNKALAANKIASFTDSNIVSKLDSVEKAIKDIKIVQQHIDLSTGMETIVDGNKTTRNNHRPTSFRI